MLDLKIGSLILISNSETLIVGDPTLPTPDQLEFFIGVVRGFRWFEISNPTIVPTPGQWIEVAGLDHIPYFVRDRQIILDRYRASKPLYLDIGCAVKNYYNTYNLFKLLYF